MSWCGLHIAEHAVLVKQPAQNRVRDGHQKAEIAAAEILMRDMGLSRREQIWQRDVQAVPLPEIQSAAKMQPVRIRRSGEAHTKTAADAFVQPAIGGEALHRTYQHRSTARITVLAFPDDRV